MDDLKIIKKYYGEQMMHFCRDNFSTILLHSGLLSSIMFDHFDKSKQLFKDLKANNLLVKFRTSIYSFYAKTITYKDELIDTNKTPEELFKEAGYTLYKCDTEEQVQSFKKYYKYDEELCTFGDRRTKTNVVFFAVKDNVNEIKRENFTNPQREDEYGTSVISLQFTKDKSHILSIKNRYNHTIDDDPDATFDNDLENINIGLTKAFEEKYGLKQKYNAGKLHIPNYVLAADGKYYKYTYEVNNVYYCPNNVIIKDFKPIKYDKERYILMDYFLFDLHEKRFVNIDPKNNDAFMDAFNKSNQEDIDPDKEYEKINIKYNSDNIEIVLTPKTLKYPIKIVLDKNNHIIEYYNSNLKEIGNKFLNENKTMKKISLDNVENIGDDFLANTKVLEELNISKTKHIKNNFLRLNKTLPKLYLPNLEDVGDNFMFYNEIIKQIYYLKLKHIGNNFYYANKIIDSVLLPNVLDIGDSFMENNESLESLSLPKVEKLGSYFLNVNNKLKTFIAKNLKHIENGFMQFNKSLYYFYLPNVIDIGNNFLRLNEKVLSVILPKVESVGKDFLFSNKIAKEIFIPLVKHIKENFMYNNLETKVLNFPNVLDIETFFMGKNNKVKIIDMPKLIKYGFGFMHNNDCVEYVNMPNVSDECINGFEYIPNVLKSLIHKNKTLKI